MKHVVVVLGVLGLCDSLLATVLGVLLGANVGLAGWFGYVGACVCFGSLAIIDAIKPTVAVVSRRRGLTAEEELARAGK